MKPSKKDTYVSKRPIKDVIPLSFDQRSLTQPLPVEDYQKIMPIVRLCRSNDVGITFLTLDGRYIFDSGVFWLLEEYLKQGF